MRRTLSVVSIAALSAALAGPPSHSQSTSNAFLSGDSSQWSPHARFGAALTFGSADERDAELLYDIEAHPQHPFRTVDDCVQHALKQLEGTTTRINFRSYDPALRNKYIDMGVTMLMESPKP